MAKLATGRKGKHPRIKGVGEAAAALGVTRDHLRWVLQGRRKSKILLARYRVYVTQQNQQQTDHESIKPSMSPTTQARLLQAFEDMNSRYQAMNVLLDLGAKRLRETLEASHQCALVLREMSGHVHTASASAVPHQAAATAGVPTCQRCKAAPAIVHLTQLRGEQMDKLDLCQADAEGVNAPEGFSFTNLAARIAAKS